MSQPKRPGPDVFVFNPFTEGYIAEGRGFSPVKHQAMLASDLSNLPQFLCCADDVVLLDERPSVQFLRGLKQAGFSLPEFVELKAGRVDPASSLRQRKIDRLRPWAWGPDSVELLEPLRVRVSGESRSSAQCFNEGVARLYSKAWSAAFLRTVLARYGKHTEAPLQDDGTQSLRAPAVSEGWLCTEQETGVAVHTLEAALDAISEIRGRHHHRVVAKQAHGLAGQSAIRLWEPELVPAQRQWLARALQNGRQVVIEPWLERELDFSIQFEMGPSRLKLVGYTGLLNDRKGQFLGNWAAADYHRQPPAEATGLLNGPVDISGHLQRFYAAVMLLLETELQRTGFVGPVGIDAMVYRSADGRCRLKPVVEINPRYTMGRLTLELMSRTCRGGCGLFRLVSLAQARKEGFDDFVSYSRSLSERLPLRLDGEASPKIREGFLCLNDPARAQVCLATFQVSRELHQVLDRSVGADLAWLSATGLNRRS